MMVTLCLLSCQYWFLMLVNLCLFILSILGSDVGKPLHVYLVNTGF